MTAFSSQTWRKVAEDDVLKRSSHAVAAIDGVVYVFGGELVARQPRDGDVHAVDVGGGTSEIFLLATTISQEKVTLTYELEQNHRLRLAL